MRKFQQVRTPALDDSVSRKEEIKRERWLKQASTQLSKLGAGNASPPALFVPSAINPPDVGGLDQFWRLLGRAGGQTGHGGTGSGQSATIASTTHPTKGFVYFGGAHLSAFDETNVRIGVGTATPAAKLHAKISVPAQFLRPVSQIQGGGWNPVPFVEGWQNCDEVVPDNDTTYIEETNSPASIQFRLTTTGTDPGVDTGHTFRITYNNPGAGTIADFQVELFNVGGSSIKLIHILNIPPASGWLTSTTVLSEAEAASIVSYGAIGVGMTTLTTSGIKVTQLELELPGEDEILQRWDDGTRTNDLTYTSDGLSVMHLQLAGTPFRIATSAFQIDIGTPAANKVWAATNVEGTGAWATETLLDGAIHSDTVAQTVTRGSLIVGNATPKWDELVLGANGTFLRSNGTDAVWAALTASMLPAHDHSSSTQGGDTLNPTTLSVLEGLGFRVWDGISRELRIFVSAMGAGTVSNLNFTSPSNTDYYFPQTFGTLVVWNDTVGQLPDAGALLYGGGAGVRMSQLTIGAAGTVLSSSGAAPQWSTAESIVDQARTWDTLQTFKDTTFKVVDDSDASKTFVLSLGGASAGADLTLAWAGTADRTVTIPTGDGDYTLAGLQVTQSFTKTQTIDVSAADIIGLKIVGDSTETFTSNLFETYGGTGALGFYVDTSAVPHFAASLVIDSASTNMTLVGTTSGSSKTITIPNANGTIPILSGLPAASGRIVFSTGTAGSVTTDADLSFTTDTLTVTKIAATQFTGNITIADAINVILNTTTGTKIGTATTQKLAFYNSTPIVQRSGAAQAAVATTAATNVAPFGYTTQAQADAIVTLVNEIRAALVALGLIAGA